MPRRQRTKRPLHPYTRPNGVVVSGAVFDIIGRAPDAYDAILDDPNNPTLDSQAGYWTVEEDDYSEASAP